MNTAQLELLTAQERAWLTQARRTEQNGWIHLRIAGDPYARGFQHGFLSAREYAEAMRVHQAMLYRSTGLTFDQFVLGAVRSHLPIIERAAPELLEEMRGIAAGYSRAGVATTLEHIVGWNAYAELAGCWWPTADGQGGAACRNAGAVGRGHSSAFIATGSATRDGQIVLGHQSCSEFWSGQFMNVLLDIHPTQGQRMVMQGCPGWIASMQDFWLTGAGLLVAENTILRDTGYDIGQVPEYIRVRLACQYARSIEDWVGLMEVGEGGARTNCWLLGDIHSNRIARFECGQRHTNFEHKSDGYYFGANVAEDPRIRNLECADNGYNDIRQKTGARRVRWPQLLDQYAGDIDVAAAQAILADTYDVYLKCVNPSGRTICAHYDADPMYYPSEANAQWSQPYYPGGSIDGKVTSAALARHMGMSARFGRADGVAFDAEDFLGQNPQWNWQQGFLRSRPTQPWVLFEGH